MTNANSTYAQLLTSIDFYIVPMFNPDGYEYTQTNDRLWRKTRSGPHCKQGLFGKKCCMGVDPNRNWDFHWNGQCITATRKQSITFLFNFS